MLLYGVSWGPCINHFLLTEWSSPQSCLCFFNNSQSGKVGKQILSYIHSLVRSFIHLKDIYCHPLYVSLLWKLRTQNRKILCPVGDYNQVRYTPYPGIAQASAPSLPRPHHCLCQYLLTLNNSISIIYFTLCHKYCTQGLK